jgi:hypothetical protein
MSQGMKQEHTLQIGTVKMIPRHIYDKPFTVRFPDRENGNMGFNLIGKGE